MPRRISLCTKTSPTHHLCPNLESWDSGRSQPTSGLTSVKPASTEQPNPPPFYDCKIFDGAAAAHPLQPQLFPHLLAMLETPSSHSYWIISSQVNRWPLFGIYIRRIVSKIRPEKREVMVREEKWQMKPRFLQTGKGFCSQYIQERTLCSPDKHSLGFQTSSFPRTRK